MPAPSGAESSEPRSATAGPREGPAIPGGTVRGTLVSTGGASVPMAVERRPGWDSPTPQQDRGLDTRQDELMGVESPDGRPPTHRVRRIEWRWLAIGACLLAVAGLVWAAARQVHWATLLAGSALVLVLLASAAPV